MKERGNGRKEANVMRMLDQKKINYKSHYYGDSGAVSGLEVARVLGEIHGESI